MLARLGPSVLTLALVAGCAARTDGRQPGPPSARRSPEAPPAPAAHADSDALASFVVLMVRHAEKADDGTPDPPLTERGRERADCLAAHLQGFSPTHLFTTPYRRNRATLEPLVAATGLPPLVLDPKDATAWQRALRELPPGARALVVGHSNTLPALVTALGGRLTHLDSEGNLPHDEYDRLVHVVVHAPDRATAYSTKYCATK
jgi:phosphohistidine phosphatase SixA